MNDAFKKFAEKMNFKFVEACSNGDHDQFVNLITTNIAAGVDAFCLNPMIETLQRDDEVCKEANVPYINAMTPYTDSQGHTLNVSVAFDGYGAGVLAGDWFEQNYSKYFDKVDISSIGFMVVNFSIVPVFAIRADGALDTYKKNHPDLEKNIYNVDLNEFSQQNAYDKVAATLSANPDVKYWAVFGVAEDFNVGACRALEATGKAADSIVISSGNDVCFSEWDNNTTPEWVATVPVYGANLAAPICAGLIALLDGRATPDTLWSDLRKPGETGVQYNIALEVATRDNYKDFIAKSEATNNAIGAK
jgi:ABC-type sugar transport system substrate-binding protein